MIQKQAEQNKHPPHSLSLLQTWIAAAYRYQARQRTISCTFPARDRIDRPPFAKFLPATKRSVDRLAREPLITPCLSFSRTSFLVIPASCRHNTSAPPESVSRGAPCPSQVSTWVSSGLPRSAGPSACAREDTDRRAMWYAARSSSHPIASPNTTENTETKWQTRGQKRRQRQSQIIHSHCLVAFNT